MAVVIKKAWSGHGAVVYRYTVNQHDYIGTSRRNWEDPRYRDVQPGGKAIVYFSASHPWLSLLYPAHSAAEAVPGLIIVLFLEFIAVSTVINPKGRWAFNFQPRPTQTSASSSSSSCLL